MKVPTVEIEIPKRPKFVWLKPCANCPTAHGPGDPESDEYASIPSLFKRMRHTFACAWRPSGYCVGNYKQQYYGKPQGRGDE